MFFASIRFGIEGIEATKTLLNDFISQLVNAEHENNTCTKIECNDDMSRFNCYIAPNVDTPNNAYYYFFCTERLLPDFFRRLHGLGEGGGLLSQQQHQLGDSVGHLSGHAEQLGGPVTQAVGDPYSLC